MLKEGKRREKEQPQNKQKHVESRENNLRPGRIEETKASAWRELARKKNRKQQRFLCLVEKEGKRKEVIGAA